MEIFVVQTAAAVMAHSDQHARSVLPTHVDPAREAVFRNTTLAGWPTPVQAAATLQPHGGAACGVLAHERLGAGASIPAPPGLQAESQAESGAAGPEANRDIWGDSWESSQAFKRSQANDRLQSIGGHDQEEAPPHSAPQQAGDWHQAMDVEANASSQG